MDRYEPATVIVLGESARRRGGNRHAAEDLQVLRILQEDRDWIWITGDDSRPTPPQLGGSTCEELRLAGIALRSRPTPGRATHEIAASMRPAAHLSMYGYSLRRACFVGNRQRLVMPAFGAHAGGGLNVLDAAFRPLFGRRRHGGVDAGAGGPLPGGDAAPAED